MPTYEYSCDRCGLMEVFQSIKESALTVCPTCGGKKIQRMISSGGGVIFKGGGFWETDYNRSADYKKKSAGTADKKSDPATPEPKPQPQLKPAPAPAPAAAPAAPAAEAKPKAKNPNKK